MSDILQQFSHLWQDIVGNPVNSAIIIGNLIIIESLLSVDNAAVLATMVMDLPQKQRERALKIGLIFAYIFRGLAMLFASFLIQFWYLKTIGGAYLLYLVYSWWRGRQTPKHEDDLTDKKSNWLYRMTVGRLGTFWGTVMMVELMDMTFSIDNVFAAVAFTPNILLVCFGVFIGILAMRFIAQRFVTLMGKYPFLEPAAFIVIGILGLKLTLSIVEHYYPESAFTHFMESHTVNMVLSLLTVAIFFLPILTSNLFNFPKKAK